MRGTMRVCCWCIIFGATFAGGDASCETVDHLDRFYHAAKRREDAVRGAKIFWKEDYVIAPQTQYGPKGPKSLPTTEIRRTELPTSLVFSGPQFSYNYFIRDLTEDFPITSSSVHVFDGRQPVSYDPPRNELKYGQGHIHGSTTFGEMSNLSIWPFLLNLRAFDRTAVGLPVDKLQVLQNAGDLFDGVGSEVVVIRWEVTGSARSCAVDAANDYRVVGYRQDELLPERTAAAPNFRLMIHDFSVDSSTGIAIPNRWAVAWYDSAGSVTESTAGTLTSYSLNPEFAPTDFKVSFPTGTLVINDITGTKGWQRADGSVDIINNNPIHKRSSKRTYGFLIMNTIALLTVLLFFIFRKRQIIGSSAPQNGE